MKATIIKMGLFDKNGTERMNISNQTDRNKILEE